MAVSAFAAALAAAAGQEAEAVVLRAAFSAAAHDAAALARSAAARRQAEQLRAAFGAAAREAAAAARLATEEREASLLTSAYARAAREASERAAACWVTHQAIQAALAAQPTAEAEHAVDGQGAGGQQEGERELADLARSVTEAAFNGALESDAARELTAGAFSNALSAAPGGCFKTPGSPCNTAKGVPKSVSFAQLPPPHKKRSIFERLFGCSCVSGLDGEPPRQR